MTCMMGTAARRPTLSALAARAHVALARVAIALGVLALHDVAVAQSSASVGPTQLAQGPSQVLPQAQQPALPGAFVLRGVVFKGATLLSNDELTPLAALKVGRPVTMADLESIANNVAELYHQRGYFLARAIVPVQEVKDGVVEISVIEGAINRVIVRLSKDAPISQERVARILEPLRPGKPLDGKVYERTVLLLSDMPGLAVQSGLEEGDRPGTVNLVIDIQPSRRFAFAAEVDNSGTKASGQERVGVNARIASPFGIGDNLDIRAQVSDHVDLWFGRIAYEAPLDYTGLRGGLGISRADYSLGGEFSDLDANGTSTIYDASLNYPLIRSRTASLFVRGWVDRKNLEDRLDAFDYRTSKRVEGAGIGFSGESRDDWGGGGYFNFTSDFYRGKLTLRDDISQALDASEFGRDTKGYFTKVSLVASRLQSLFPRNSLFLSLGGQLASHNLDASEKLALGGSHAVRAYSSNADLVDEGLIGTAEYRYALFDSLALFAFRDYGHGRPVHDPSAGDQRTETIRANGIGVTWSQAGNFSMSGTIAWRDSAATVADGDGKNPRFYWQLQKVF